MTEDQPPATAGRRVRALLTPDRLTRFGVAVAIGLAVAFGFAVATASGSSPVFGEQLGGDWAAFRGAGVLAAQDPALLLDPQAQLAEIGPWLDGGLLTFVNPPIFAFLFVPASWVSFGVGYAAYVALLAAAAAYGTVATMDVLGIRDPRWRRVGVLGAMTWLITFRAYSGAQNATITLFLLAVGYRLADRRPWLAGLVFGALWYKPQFAVPLIGLLVVAGRWRTAASATGVGIALWAASAVIFGADWVTTWYDRIVVFTDEGNRLSNAQHTISPVELVRWSVDGSTGLLLGLAVAAAIGLAAAVVVWRAPAATTALPLTCAALLLTAPHALVYELTLLTPVLGAWLLRARSDALPWVVGAWLLGAPLVALHRPALRMAFMGMVLVAAWRRDVFVGRNP